ncbi:MAG: MFS transporter, partial [Clostridiales Family XIII bacterium]|nr:MFS transporter [Clostridiales Family XIII bacterium]
MQKQKEKINSKNFILMLAHFSVDLSQGALPAVLPYLIVAQDLTYFKATFLVFFSSLLSAVLQPFFGYLGDRAQKPWFIIAGMLVAAVGISLVGIVDTYPLLCLCSLIGGLGSSLFHPEGSKMASVISGNRKSVGMSIFAVGGNIGFVVGPILATVSIHFLGLKGLVLFMAPAIILSLLVRPHLGEIRELNTAYKNDVEEAEASEGLTDNVKGFTIVSIVMFLKSTCGFVLTSFIPLFWIGIFMSTEWEGGLQLSLFAAASAVCTVAGGWMAEKIGAKRLIIICSCSMPIVAILFAFNRSPLLASLLLLLLAVGMNGAHSILLVTGQNFMPRRLGTASGILFGVTVSMGGFVAPFIGKIGDIYGLVAVFISVALIAAAMAATSFFIPFSKLPGKNAAPAPTE